MPSSTVHSKSAALLSVPVIRPLKERLSGPAYLPLLRVIRPRQTESDSPRRPKSRRAHQRDQKPPLTRIPKISRDFHRKIEENTLTGDCSEEDEDLMDCQSGPSTSSSRGGASAAQ
ncbi:hypothetical protein TNCV_2585281 [Trichonephila clavipes]|nr:hypothetical protein TNCV_2585281 [Trichonephila clavipes]